MGHEAILSPLMTMRFEPIPDLGTGIVQALILTSRNAVRALARGPLPEGLLELPVFAVGKNTARDARDFGFHGVMEGPGTAKDLVDVVAGHADPEGGRLVHLAGYKLAFDLDGALRAKGFEVDVVRCYEARAAESLTPEAEAALRAGHLDAVLLMSPESSRTYVRLVEAAGLSEAAKEVACACISESTAAALVGIGARRVQVSTQPRSEEVLALINRIAEQSGP